VLKGNFLRVLNRSLLNVSFALALVCLMLTSHALADEHALSAYPVWRTLQIEPNRQETVSDRLSIERDSKSTLLIPVDGFIREWRFWDGGKSVAVYYGPRHLAGAYTLYDVATGKMIATHSESSKERAPTWAKFPTATSSLPKEVAAYTDRVSECLRWAGEVGDNSPGRAAEIGRAVQSLQCDRLSKDLLSLRRKFALDAVVQRALDGATRSWFDGEAETLEESKTN
jgi:hypothetical protein